MSDLRYSAQKTFKVSIDFTEEELGQIISIVTRSKLYRERTALEAETVVYTPLEQRLKAIVYVVIE